MMPPSYSYESFVRDLRWLGCQPAELVGEELQQAVAVYYTAQHPSDLHATDNQARLLAAFGYLQAHQSELMVEHWVRMEADGTWVSPCLEAALFRLFSLSPRQQLTRPLPLSIVLDLAEEQRRVAPEREQD